MEAWKKIEGYGSNYSVSDQGRVRRDEPGCGCRAGTILKANTKKPDEYPQVNLYKNGVAVRRRVHLLVADAFMPPRPKGRCANHKNGIKTDARLENLEWVTQKENVHHAISTGLMHPGLKCKGENNGRSKLTEDAVREIRDTYMLVGSRVLAERFGVSTTVILLAYKRKKWKHVA